MLRTTVSPRAAVAALVAALAVTSAAEWRALSAADPAPRTLDRAYCLKCHADAATVAKMKAKEGGAHFVFGTPPPACPASASLMRAAARGKTVSR